MTPMPDLDPSTSTFDWDGLAIAIADFPGLAETIRAQHQPDHTGHCRTCQQLQNGTAPSWPCNLGLVAEMAVRSRTGRSSQARHRHQSASISGER